MVVPGYTQQPVRCEGLVIARTLDHIYLPFTPSVLISELQGIAFPGQRKESKQMRAGGEAEGRTGREKRRERSEARTICVNAGRGCKASRALTDKCTNFLRDFAQRGGGGYGRGSCGTRDPELN